MSMPNIQRVPRMSEQQQQFLSQMLGHLQGSPYQEKMGQMALGSPEIQREQAAPAEREFREQIMPQLAEQFAGSGMLRSSPHAAAAAHAGESLSEKLGSQAVQNQMNALQQMLGLDQNMMGLAMGAQPFENVIQEEERAPGLMEMITPFAKPALGAAAGGLSGGWPGAAAGLVSALGGK